VSITALCGLCQFESGAGHGQHGAAAEEVVMLYRVEIGFSVSGQDMVDVLTRVAAALEFAEDIEVKGIDRVRS